MKTVTEAATQSGKKPYQFINGAALKWIAIITMICDHFNKSIMYYFEEYHPVDATYVVSDILSALGRIAFPLFAFLLAEGFVHTKNRGKYLLRLIIFAIISEIPFNLLVSGSLWESAWQNVMWTLAIAFVVLWGIDITRTKTKYWPALAFLITAVGCIGASFAAVDYGMFGVIVPVLLYLSRPRYWIGSILSLLVLIKEYLCFPAFILIFLYNGEKGRQHKYLFYAIYPAHLLIFGLFRYFTGL